ncbi:uncharacterized protein K452DRAFT_311331 [Aplosporella prunicola CBS 121167]|uniref:Rhodopsin domain-containing protein n=1 Tax=Aplosporella prunicola CBS 121167 TaxID=1176127 RepID=A0A6A6B3T6_9PEZI|nr:uncharacterized protein K452DRAFT_311331 [Aplosporella prunicola CBS 121167]KAF2138879.1 hypothetical protein K452DRAFT_311331 [Aplosporella prunicola CBS 121167]
MAVDPTIQKLYGQPPDNVDLSESRVLVNSIIAVIILIIAIISVILRLISRSIQKIGLKWDDFFILVGTAFAIPTVGLVVGSGALGSGKHIWTVSAPHLVNAFKLLYSYPYIYAACVTTTKFSIILFYFRIFGKTGSNNVFIYPCYFAGILNGLYPIIMWIVMATCCRPISTYWNSYVGVGSGECIDVNTFFLALGIMNMVNDVIILVIPIPQILKLHMNTRKKISIVGILLLGGFVCVASCIRIYYLTRWSAAKDISWAMGPVFIWSSVEPAIGIVSACLPTLGPLFHFARDRSYGSSSNNRSGYTPHTGASAGWRNKSNSGAQATFGGGRFFRDDKTDTFVREEDEINLTSIAAGPPDHRTYSAGGSLEEGLPEHGIVATTRIEHQVT